MFLTWLPKALRDAGIDVYVMPGAETRSTWASGLTTVHGVVWHHTATSIKWLDGHVAALLRDGRRDLRGPLSQVGIERDGTWVIVALGRANHNGYGLWGNNSVGLEFYNDGLGEPFTQAQIDSGVLGTAVILRRLGLGAAQTKGHKETDPGRKIDPRLSMDFVRSKVSGLLVPKPAPEPTPSPVPTPPADYVLEDDDMKIPAFLVVPEGSMQVYLTDNVTKQPVLHPDHLASLICTGVGVADPNGKPFVWDKDHVASIRTVQ